MEVNVHNLRLIEAAAATPAGAALLKAIDDKGPEAVLAWRGGLTAAALDAAGPRIPGASSLHGTLVSCAVGCLDTLGSLTDLEQAWTQRKAEGHPRADEVLLAVRTLLAELRRRAAPVSDDHEFDAAGCRVPGGM